ncbi:sodium:proline symporter [Propionigenium maris DSM 9537]|uniref:Sodium:proline symporter n=1 Tax=Propionigenium maris DSM 9537 TaxID=1123000 RepID=A0A9W6GNL0_9FUSO|nr:sodium:solute symporter family protein [Propionigenium maris]GLI56847.1 sodium:proline symporter [Propionigenium maris DSM 9537]
MNRVFYIVLATAIVLLGSGAISLYIGKRCNTSEDWDVGGRSLPLYVTVGSQFATVMGGGMLVAHVGLGYSSGWATLTYGLFLSGVMFILSFFAKWFRSQEFTTIPDILERFYGKSKGLTLAAVLATIIVPFGWICTQLVAVSKLFSSLLGVSPVILIIIFAIISLLFVLPAGLASVAWTDFIFSCLMIVVSIGSLVFAFNMGGGVSNIFANIPPDIKAFPGSMTSVGWPTILLWMFAILPGGLTNQLYYQRIGAIKDIKYAKKSLIYSGLLILFAEFWAIYLGFSIRSMAPNLQPEMASAWFLDRLPIWFLAIYSGFLVATIISTIDSAIHAVVVNFTTDILGKVISTDSMDSKKRLHTSRVFAVGVTAAAVAIAVLFPQALKLLVLTYAFSASVLLAPIFLGYFYKDSDFLTIQGAIASMICGFLGCIVGMTLKTSVPYVLFGLVSSFISLILVSKFTKRESEAAEEKIDFQ